MEKLVINGGRKLVGEVTISGAKNAAVAIIPATLLVCGKCRIENIPAIHDVYVIVDIIRQLGALVSYDGPFCVEIDATNLAEYRAPYDMVKSMRASYYLIGALLGRFGKAEVSMPGGCNFGSRPIDQHIKGFEMLGAKVEQKGIIKAYAENLVGKQIFLDVVSVGATINIMLAAVKAEGTTTIENVAKEPHIVDLANCLNAMGAKIKGAGTDVIKIQGVKKLHGCTYTIIPDQIEAGTFMVAAAATGGDVLIKNIIPRHLEPITAKLVEMGVTVTECDDSVRVTSDGNIIKANVKTLPYPGFPTDMQPQMVAMLSIARGTSMVTESVWESRYQYVDELTRLGADITINGKTAVIEGVDKLTGTSVKATDLRAGAGMVIAGLIAEGTTEIYDIKHIDRGYESLENKFLALGADIKRVAVTENERI